MSQATYANDNKILADMIAQNAVARRREAKEMRRYRPSRDLPKTSHHDAILARDTIQTLEGSTIQNMEQRIKAENAAFATLVKERARAAAKARAKARAEALEAAREAVAAEARVAAADAAAASALMSLQHIKQTTGGIKSKKYKCKSTKKSRFRNSKTI